MTKKITTYRYLLLCLLIPFQVFAQDWNPAIPRDTSFTIHSTYLKFKHTYSNVTPVKDNTFSNTIEQRNVIYATLDSTKYGKRELHMDIFRPKKTGSYPAILLIHGGGWVTGSKANMVPLAQYLASKGYVAVAMEYQLLLEAKYPAAIYNAKAAIRWLRAHADELHINPDKIAIGGTSAGGEIAALTGLTGDLPKFEGNQGIKGYSTKIQAIVDLDGVIDFMAPWSLNLPRTEQSMDVQWLGGTFLQRPDRWRDASPIFWAGNDSPPILFLTSPHPRFTAGRHELIAMYNRWGIYNETHTFNVRYHAFWLVHPWADDAYLYISQFLDRTLKDKVQD